MQIFPHNQTPSVFISSTFIDLKNERRLVASTLEKSGVHVNALDVKPASTNTSKVEIINGIRQSDFLILIIGNRYGTINPSFTSSTEISITEWEYRLARKSGKPVIAIFKEVKEISSTDNSDPTTKQKLENFKNIIHKHHNPRYFESDAELCNIIKKSLVATYWSSIKKLNASIKDQASEIEQLRTELENLKRNNQRKSSYTFGLGAHFLGGQDS